MPAQAVLGARPLGDEILAMVHEEPDLAVGPVEGRDREILAEGRPGSSLSGGDALVGHRNTALATR